MSVNVPKSSSKSRAVWEFLYLLFTLQSTKCLQFYRPLNTDLYLHKITTLTFSIMAKLTFTVYRKMVLSKSVAKRGRRKKKCQKNVQSR